MGISPQIVAHRGGAGEAAENTLAAFSQALLVADWIECDVRLSKDHIPIVVHDPSTQRLFSGEELSFHELSYQEIKKLLPLNKRVGPIPSLQSVLEKIGSKASILLELKEEHAFLPLFVERVLQTVTLYQKIRKTQLIMSSFSPAILEEIQRQTPHQPLGLIAQDIEALRASQGFNLALFALSQDLVSPALVAELKTRGGKVWVWTINDLPTIEKYTSMGIDGVITDFPRLAREHFPKN
ncbi:MAG: glycerophosphodiester phosphodiesterase [Chlamydiota bacterium]